MLGLTSACGQQNFENTDVKGFAELAANPNAVIVDVRTAEEFNEGHIDGALNIDVKQEDFLKKAKAVLSTEKKIAVYCRSGRRSANAAEMLAAEGYQCVNLQGGILAWKEAKMPVTTDDYEVDVFKTKSGKTVKFHALVHASIRIEYDGREIQIDPVTQLGNKVIGYAAMLSNDKTRLVTNKRCADMLGTGEVMSNGDKMQIAADFTVEAVPAYNTTEGHLQFHPKGRDNGYILTIDGLRIYIAGDTEDIPEMSEIKDIDIAFLPCNQPYTMTTEQLVKAAKTVQPRVLFPYHYGKTDVSTIPALLKEAGVEVRIRHYE